VVKRAAALGLMALALAACGNDRRAGGDLYRQRCARCHGTDGRGDPRSTGLYPGLDLTASRMVRAGSQGRGLVYQRIAEGYGAMPGFGESLDTQDLNGLIDYVLRLPQEKANR
jgi:mono/diheme cytochrome c family protein